MTIQKIKEKISIFGWHYSIGFLIMLLAEVTITTVTNLTMTQLLYVGPFLIAIIGAEKAHQHEKCRGITILRRVDSWFYIAVWQLIFLTIVLTKGGLSVDGVGIVYVLQLIFSASGMFTAHAFQWARKSKY
ncbi:hypothetical protein [Thalassotalea piscium]|uniref:Uncharacterized protein n=1 Tax=Thalassotalea piscium TaxID=1230533 RepID=A0A7X0NGL1_9GAMM|nr:hypothetical protein [Thalassotalea piscium]MBB6543086.1 hypothetical protein [Thalassotalea piscium]